MSFLTQILVSSKDKMRAFDALPRSIRDVLNQSPCNFSPMEVLSYLHRHGEEKTLQHIHASERARLEQRAPP